MSKLNPNASAWMPPGRKAAPAPAAAVPSQPAVLDLSAASTTDLHASATAPTTTEAPQEKSSWEDSEGTKDSVPGAAQSQQRTEEKAAQPPKEDREKEQQTSDDAPASGSSESAEEVVIPKRPPKNVDPRDHLSLVFIGHVDAGKSTTAGNVLFLTGQVDQRTIEKYEKESKEKAGSSWYLAYIMDTNEEERAKGKTVEVGRAIFMTEKRRYTILDAPGHKNYVPNMIGGAACADVGILVISARINEFEAGFDKGGQTREHAMLAKTLGINRLVVVINKMDDKSVQWGRDRYDGIVSKLTPFLKQVGFAPKDVAYLPISGINGINLQKPIDSAICPWYTGSPLIDVLDNLAPPRRDPNAALRIPILDKIKDAGKVFIEGKVESGTVRLGQKVAVMPNKQVGTITAIATDFDPDLDAAPVGENVRIVISGIVEENIHSGFVVCDAERPIIPVPQFEAQLAVIDLLDHKPIFSPGYTAVLHAHTAVEECTVKLLLGTYDKAGNLTPNKPKFVKRGGLISARIQLNQPVCLEAYKEFPQLGRFTLRDEGKTIAIGKVTRLPQARPTATGASSSQTKA